MRQRKNYEAAILNNAVGTHGTLTSIGILEMGIMMQFSNYLAHY